MLLFTEEILDRPVDNTGTFTSAATWQLLGRAEKLVLQARVTQASVGGNLQCTLQVSANGLLWVDVETLNFAFSANMTAQDLLAFTSLTANGCYARVQVKTSSATTVRARLIITGRARRGQLPQTATPTAAKQCGNGCACGGSGGARRPLPAPLVGVPRTSPLLPPAFPANVKPTGGGRPGPGPRDEPRWFWPDDAFRRPRKPTSPVLPPMTIDPILPPEEPGLDCVYTRFRVPICGGSCPPGWGCCSTGERPLGQCQPSLADCDRQAYMDCGSTYATCQAIARTPEDRARCDLRLADCESMVNFTLPDAGLVCRSRPRF